VIDSARIHIRAGDGGHGLINFRREKYVPRGGPDGGDGGRGGDVVLIARESINGLGQFRYKKEYKAQAGGNGAGGKKHGKNGADLVLAVPPGTIARDGLSGDFLGEVTDVDQTLLIARGGKGGRGNVHFATPSNQAPYISETGQRGEERWVELELKLLSDVGLVGLPNAGKSTLVSAVSRAQPRIADYPFTTLEPVLGVVEVGFDSYVMADLPGLIEGAHEGHGLGLEFLRHVERTRLLVHVVDASRPDPAQDVAVIDHELASYRPPLSDRPQVLAFNKMDIPDAQERKAELAALARDLGRQSFFISAAGRQGTEDLAKAVFEILQRLRESDIAPIVDEAAVLRPRPRGPRFTIEHEEGAWRVTGEQPVLLVEMLALQSDESRAETMRRLGRMGVVNALRRAGVKEGDRVRFGDIELRWEA
jgi:GTP-binding protein